ncbi:MAG TPA: pentapeptide repeat-containing protein [Candidatus Limnocylindrales bacterium]|nr:pentapeptide repeat-containing protein [Candidatus Limnocylindrales bacterium]
MRRFAGTSAAALALISALLFLLVAVVPASASRTRDCSDRTLEPGADLRRCDLREMPVAGADLTGAVLDRATLAGMILDKGPDGPQTKLYDASIVRADLAGTHLSNTDARFADFTGADLSDTVLEDTRLADAVLRGADLSGAHFFFTEVARTDFQRADLRGASLTWSFFLDADFRHARFDGADLTGANLTGGDLRGAKGLHTVTWASTTCPDGTNSDVNGGTCLGHL